MYGTRGWISLVSALSCLISGPIAAETLAVYPGEIRLDHKRDRQRLVVVLTRDDGVTLDVTDRAAVRVEPQTLASWDEGLRLIPGQDGEGLIRIEYEGKMLEAPLVVRNAELDPPMSFRNDVEAALMRAGCNAGACHGSAQGKNGFRLSLFGFDPAADYIRLTRELLGRRVNVAEPGESLLLLKPTAQVDHEGGERFTKRSPLYRMIERWIREGAQDDPPDAPKPTGLHILPSNAVLEGPGAVQRFVVQAAYSDGTDRDVTDLAILSSGDDAVVAIDEEGVARSGDRGEAYVMARFATYAVVSQIISVPAEDAPAWPDVAPANYIDELVYDKLRKLRVPPAEHSSDETFVRRVYLDVLGVLPTVEKTRAFLENHAPDKRANLIDTLLERPEFSELWAMKWAEVLQVRTTNEVDRKAMHRYNDWLRSSIANNKPIGDLVKELLTAQGGNFTAPAVNFYLLEDEPAQMAENVAQAFLGLRIQCAQCHNHPFERWTMDDYYSFAAFFAQVGRKRSSDPRELIVFNRGNGEVKNLRDGQVMAPKFLGGDTPEIGRRDRRAVLADWLVAPENPWFAKNVANRVWHHFFGRGIIDPPDDVRVTNPPSNARLLDELGARLVSYNYDLRRLVRDICNSNTYQQSTRPRDPALEDPKNFAVMPVRRLPSEVLLDAVCRVTGTPVKFPALPLGARAVEVAGGASGNYFLEVFGRPARESACTCDRRNEPTLAQTLHLINGDTVSNALRANEGRLPRQIAEQTPTDEAIEELYLAAYSRFPTEAEASRLVEYVDSAEDRRQALEDVYWSVLNSKEFVFTH